jgi:beta-galactosidase
MYPINQKNISLTSEAIYIDGSPRILLCASLFYFRLPRAVWKDRLRKVKKAGYHCIDVYFPWNYHELHYNEWDFTGERDIEVFLREATEEGLLVVARPGPYICSEWDGGALPAYLFAEENIQLRDNDPVFLQHVDRWFKQIMPILSEYQYGRSGTIICIQLDNELDFYNCTDPLGYISALRDMANQYDFIVPYIACSGQGDLFRASGNAEGVVPTCNFYPNDKEPQFEGKVFAYVRELRSRQLPLMVTETNRSHYLLRRLLSVGAKLLGPYLQASGTDFGFTTAVSLHDHGLRFSRYDFTRGTPAPRGWRRTFIESTYCHLWGFIS